jgi:hypothetical protein
MSGIAIKTVKRKTSVSRAKIREVVRAVYAENTALLHNKVLAPVVVTKKLSSK